MRNKIWKVAYQEESVDLDDENDDYTAHDNLSARIKHSIQHIPCGRIFDNNVQQQEW